MDIRAKTCTKCNGTGHDKGGMPVVKMIPFDPNVHTPYIKHDQPIPPEQKRYHQTIKQGSGCMACGGVGYVELEAS